ncbi:fatty-acid-binding protein 2 [Vitis vinifera]|eukprot:XP_002280130.1 PREDICTED: fatty-acid-binding protein 2 [Vitis vinifera]
MRNIWLFFMDFDGGSPYIDPTESISNSFGGHLLSHVTSFVDNSVYGSRRIYAPGSAALQEAFDCISKFAGAVLLQLSSGSNSNIRHRSSGDPHVSKPKNWKSCAKVDPTCSCKHNLTGFCFSSRSKGKASGRLPFDEVSNFTIRQFCREVQGLESIPVFTLAAALVPPLDNLTPKVMAVPLEDTGVRSCEIEHQRSSHFSFPDLNWTRHAVEPRTGIEFPTILDNILVGENNSSLTSEVLVGTGSRTMKIIKIKSLKVYAFGFYVHPLLICEKLGPKYASIPVDELNKRQDFYEDLLREDINMTVRLVVNCNGMKINTVRDAFEKSLRNRLLKTNPDTDYQCLTTFGSYFTQDIPLPAGTTIDFRRTADGQLITEIGGRTIGVVHSKDLCRAFFDMYIGDVPVSHQTKEEIGRNVANIIRRC